MYIRTKDKIMLTEDYLKNSETFQMIKHLDGAQEKYLQGYLQSENLEELCDVIVYECKNYYNNYQKYEIGNVDSLQWNKNNDLLSNIYGAIWTSKGLIYVAKMNQNGGLELI